MSEITIRERYLGCLLGLACGDAVGTTLEFCRKDTYEPISGMVGGGPFNLEPGQWTDDTSMALCLAHSLVYKNGFDAIDQMNRYCNWWQYGYMSSTGDCFDIGATVQAALNCYLKDKNPYAGSVDPFSSGNGSLMRLAPIPLFYYPEVNSAIEYAGKSSRTTHGSEECIDSCKYFASIICVALNGEEKNKLLESSVYWPTTYKLKEIVNSDFLSISRENIHGTGYVIQSIEAALWCFFTTNTFEEAILMAANLGDDADTTAAICGQLAGAHYGVRDIPERWLNNLSMRNEIESLAIKLI